MLFRLVALCCLMPAMALALATPISLTNARSLPTIAESNIGVAFISMTNTGTKPLTLIGAQSSVSKKVEIHTHETSGDIMQMRKIDRVDIPAGATIEMQPGGLHLMLIGLRQPLAVNQQFDVILTFKDQPPVTQRFVVQAR